MNQTCVPIDRCMLSRSLSIWVRAVPKCIEALASAPPMLGLSVAYLRQSSASLVATNSHQSIRSETGQQTCIQCCSSICVCYIACKKSSRIPNQRIGNRQLVYYPEKTTEVQKMVPQNLLHQSRYNNLDLLNNASVYF